MSINDRELPETLDLIAKLVASVSTRVDEQTKALADLAKAQVQAQTKARTDPGLDPDYVARVTAEALRRILVPEVNKIVEAMNELNGTKAVLRERWRVVDREEARLGRWLFLPLAVTVGIPLALATVLALVMPIAASQTSLTCRATGGTWSEPTERFLSGCTYTADERATAGRS